MSAALFDLSIVIVSWNEVARLRECLGSILMPLAFRSMRVVVVDNASADGSAEMVEQTFPTVQVIRNTENVGFARANNQGITASTSRLVLLLNSDTRVPPGALPRLVTFMDEHPQAGAVGPRLIRPNGEAQAFAFGSDPTPGYLLRRGLFRLIRQRALHDWDTNQIQAVNWISGACLLARREALDQVGLLDENIFMYFEDNDLCLRMRRAGWKIFFNPQVTIIHVGGVRLAQSAARTRWYDASLRYFYSKHYSPLARIVLEMMLPFYRRID